MKTVRGEGEWSNGRHMNKCSVIGKGRASRLDRNFERWCDYDVLVESSYERRSMRGQ